MCQIVPRCRPGRSRISTSKKTLYGADAAGRCPNGLSWQRRPRSVGRTPQGSRYSRRRRKLRSSATMRRSFAAKRKLAAPAASARRRAR
jgi:hypothetical protein